MINDVLYDAIEEIKDYQEKFPDSYQGPTKELIEAVKTQMEDLAGWLWMPGAPGSH